MVEVALGRGANCHCVAMNGRIQRKPAPLAAGVGLQRTDRQTDRHIYSTKCTSKQVVQVNNCAR